MPEILTAISAVKLLLVVASKAKDFHKFYSGRDGELKTFAECVSRSAVPN
jgi:hypothetical protein